MKKTLMFASCLLAAVAFTACSDDDNNTNGDEGATTPAPEMGIDEFNTKYDLEATLDVDTATFNYASMDGQMFRWINGRVDENGDSIPDFIGQYFVAADNEYVDKVLGFLDAEVFPVFGEEFISKYMPRTIYFASEVQYNPYYNNRNLGLVNHAKDIHYAFEGGTCCPNYIMFSHCCADFDTMDKTYLKRLYTSLVVEYIFSNIANSQLVEPTEFNQYSLDYTVGVDLGFMIFSLNQTCDAYYESSADDFETGWLNESVYWNSFEEIVNGENSISFPEAEIDAETGLWKWINESSTITPDALSDLLISGYGTKTESDITSTGLPMSYKDDAVVLTTETNQALKTFEMKRAVVKLHTKFQNDGLETTVNKISFGAFQADKGYLFEQNGSNMIVPNDVTYSSYTTPDNYSLRIGAGIEESVSFYQLPSKVASEVYTFGFNLEDGSNFGMAELKPSTGDLTFIDRNTQLEINVTLNAVEIEFATPAVEPWKSVADEGGIINVE